MSQAPTGPPGPADPLEPSGRPAPIAAPALPAAVRAKRPAQIAGPRQHGPVPSATRERGPVPSAPWERGPVPSASRERGPVIHAARPGRRDSLRPVRSVRPRVRPVRVSRRRRLPIGWIAGGLVFLGLFCVGMGLGNATGLDIGGWFRGPDEPPPRAFPVLEPSRPLRLTIPAIKVEAPIQEVGLAKDGSVDVPPLAQHDEAGWFNQGPTPGQFGPAMIVGHADTRTGPSVFNNLAKLKPGQVIEVLRDDHEVALFTVNSVENFGKAKLPIQRVYADYSRPSLRLVTCGGTWIGGRGYSDNVIVFASLTGTKKR